jgi:hypothetical protein
MNASALFLPARARLALWVLLCLVMAGCSRQVPVVFKQQFGKPVTGAIKISLGDQELATGPKADGMKFSVPASLKDRAPVLVQIEGPEGWVPCKSHFTREGEHFELSFQPDGITEVWVDNEEGPKGELQCGSLNLSIEAERKNCFAIASPTRDKVPVTFGGTKVGEMAKYPACTNYLLDTTGKHSYQMRQLNYLAVDHVKLLGDEPAFAPKFLGKFAGGFWHALPQGVDFGLQPAPKRLTLTVTEPGVKTELVRVK